MFRREVYRNLNFRNETVYSVRKDGLVEGHALQIVMDGSADSPVTFAVGPKGNQRVRDEQRKNVHAVIRGYMQNALWYPEDELDLPYLKEHAKGLEGMEWGVPVSRNTKISDLDDPRAWTPMFEWKQVLYNPYKYQTFVTVDLNNDFDGIVTSPIYNARKVIIGPKVWAMVPTQDKQEEN